MARTVYWVSPYGGRWKVQREGSQQASNVYDTKDMAIDRARELAHAHQPSQVKVQRANGTIETEWTYSNDPYPPPG